MKRYLTLIIIALMAFTASAANFSNEKLNYDIVYHWGMIWKHAGQATLTLNRSGDRCNSVLACRTISWADKIFKVRDTLSCSFSNSTLRPTIYRKNAYEGKNVCYDRVVYSYSGNNVHADCRHERRGKKVNEVSFDATAPAFDMLSIFYYLRTLNYDKMSANDTQTVTVFSGHRKEQLKIRYVGVENIELRDKTKHRAFHIKFSFTQDGKKKSSDDLDTWISMNNARIPLMLKGKLPIGEVRCYYKE
ncbi:MAG: DUF3108 domain-containing protein [Candidatus Limisoma sp.]